jgi:hypothetical protein
MNEAHATFRRVHGQQSCGREDRSYSFTLIGACGMNDDVWLNSIQKDADFLGILKFTDVKGHSREGCGWRVMQSSRCHKIGGLSQEMIP